MAAALNAVVTLLIIRRPEPRDFVLALFVIGLFLAFAELWCDRG